MKIGIAREMMSEVTNPTEMVDKVEKDIAFLNDRIQRMTEQKNPNTTAIATYRSLLESRVIVLDWLHEQHGDKIQSAQRVIGF